jgi:hypothetical protein
MATQTREHDAPPILDVIVLNNGLERHPAEEGRSLFDHVHEFWGIFKDDPEAREVLDGILASRHRDY